MTDLPNTHPWLHQQFMAGGFHSIRRSDRFWAGLSTDLTIEQVMMRSIKSRGGLTHGRGMSERLMWVSCINNFGMVHDALSHLTGLDHTSDDDGYADNGKSRKKRDFLDLNRLLHWFEARNPFHVIDCRLHSLASGKAASEADEINCDFAEEVGLAIMCKMDDVPFTAVALKKSDKAKTLAHVNSKVLSGGIRICQWILTYCSVYSL